MEEKGLNPENLNEICDYIFKSCINFMTDYDNPLLKEEEIDEYWTTL